MRVVKLNWLVIAQFVAGFFLQGVVQAEEEVNETKQWMAFEYQKRFDKKVEEGALDPPVPKDLKGKKRELQFWQAGYVSGVLEHRTLEGLKKSMAYAHISVKEKGVFLRHFEGWEKGSRAAYTLGSKIKDELKEELHEKLIRGK